MKFASYLGSKDRIFILDEPTNGLHIKNVRSLLKLLNQMVDEGNSIFVIEHNIEFIKSADYVVELRTRRRRCRRKTAVCRYTV